MDWENISLTQPFFVMNSEYYLKKKFGYYGISHFYKFYKRDEMSTIAVPDGCIDIIFTNEKDRPEAYICGTELKGNWSILKPGVDYFGVRFYPGQFSANISIPIREIVGQQLSLSMLMEKRKSLIEEVSTANSFEEQIHIFLKSFCGPLTSKNEKKKIFQRAVQIINDAHGNISIKKLSETTFYSTRYLADIFDEFIGISPKEYSVMIRFQSALKILNESRMNSLTDLSNFLGYYDQSHFLREFKKYALLSPSVYKKMIKTVNYRSKIQIY